VISPLLHELYQNITDQLDPNQGDHEGNTPLAWCIVEPSSIQTMGVLLKYFPACDPHKPNKVGSSPLHLAYDRYKTEEDISHLKHLLSAPSIDLENYDIVLITSEGVTHDDHIVLRVFCEAGVDPSSLKDDADRSLLALAEIFKAKKVLKLFRDVIAKSNQQPRG
jgi:ankyrin repeat protein